MRKCPTCGKMVEHLKKHRKKEHPELIQKYYRENEVNKQKNPIKEFEKKLDDTLLNLKIHQYNGKSCIMMCGEILERTYNKNQSFLLHEGFQILLPYLINNKSLILSQGKNTFEAVVEALEFACHYKILRDYLYYAYNVKDSIKWIFGKNKIEIRFNDKSIPRQSFFDFNRDHLGNIDLIPETNQTKSIILNLLKDTREFEVNERYKTAIDLIQNTVLTAFSRDYNFIELSEIIDLGKYNYQQFYEIYFQLKILALYKGLYNLANKKDDFVYLISKKELAEYLSDKIEISKKICESVLFDLAYHQKNIIKDSMHFSLIYFQESDEFLIIPSLILITDSFIDILRLLGKRDPELFLNKLSDQLGNNLVKFMSDEFNSIGFKVRKNVKLKKFDSCLPDIDLLAIAKVSNQKYYLFIIEAKNPIPAKWGKFYLKALGKKGYMTKALKQIEQIEQFLKTKKGNSMIYKIISEEYVNNTIEFNERFSIIKFFFIISSQNVGMFFSTKNKVIIDYKHFKRIIERSNGDVYYILNSIEYLLMNYDKHFEICDVCFKIEDKEIIYDGIFPKKLIDFI